jgi:hypothetical protein
MNTNYNEDERRRVIAQLQEVVRRRHVASETGKDPGADFALRAKRADAPLELADVASRQRRNLQKAVPDERVPRPAPHLQGRRDPEIKRFRPPGRGPETAAADNLAEGAEMAPLPGAARSDATRDRGNYRRELEEEVSTSLTASADVRSRRYLLGAAAIIIILTMAAASFTFHNSPGLDETARVTEVETPKPEQDEVQTGAAPQDAAAEAQEASALRDKVEDTSEAPRSSDSGPAASEDRGSATEAHNPPIASPRLQVQDPLAQRIESFDAPTLPTGAFSAQEPPQPPAAEPTNETLGGPDKIAHARDETPVEPLTVSPQSPPKTAPLPPRRAVTASAERPRAKAAEAKQKAGSPPQENSAEANLPSEDIVQRTIDSLFNGWKQAPN